MSLFGKAMRSIVDATKALSNMAGQTDDAVWTDLQVLDRIEPGLARKVYDYVTGAGDSMALSTISQKDKGWLSAGQFVHRTDRPGIYGRRRLFTDLNVDPDFLVRYVHVLAASLQGNRSKLRDLPATDATPIEVQLFLTELNFGYKFRTTTLNEQPLPQQPVGRVMEIVGKLGGTAEDLFDVVFFNDTGYASGKGLELADRMDMAELVRAHPQAFVAQDKRLPLAGRQRLLEFIEKHDLASEPPFSGLVIETLGDSSKVIRDTALKVFAKTDRTTREKTASHLLANGKSNMRSSMVEVLMGVGTESARACLAAHLETEKTARIRTLIEAYLSATDIAEAENSDETADEAGYRALDGGFVTIPPRTVPEGGPLPAVTDEVRTRLLTLGKKLEDDYQRDLRKEHQPYYVKYASSLDPEVFARTAEKVLQGDPAALKDGNKEAARRSRGQETQTLIAEIRATYPLRTVLEQDLADLTEGTRGPRHWDYSGRLAQLALGFLDRDETADFRFIDSVLGETFEIDADGQEVSRGRSRLLDVLFKTGRRYLERDSLYYVPEDRLTDFGKAAWPLIAENFWFVDEKMGLAADRNQEEDKLAALIMLECLPALPARYGPYLLDIAMSGKKLLRNKARAILVRSSGYEERLVSLLEDSRQDVRASAAKWLGEIGHGPAVKALQKRLKKEKSAVAEAAILAALKELGQDLSAYIGPDALLKEAEKRLKTANFKDVDWLDLQALPQLNYLDGKPVPAKVLQWWIALAVKLKSPGDTDLFDLYLDQLTPDDAATLSTWLFDAWLGYDTAPPPRDYVDTKVAQLLSRYGPSWKGYFPDRADWTKEQQFEFWVRQVVAETPNSGAKSKGLLALAGNVPPTHAVSKIRTYLRKHGGRTSQATALLELMAAKGDAMSLQVVIAAATRLRQKGVQAKAKEMVQAVADRKDWTMDQLADRTVPTGGIEDDGRLELACSGGDKLYVARLDEKLGLILFNPDGKVVKALPAGDDEETKASKKTLSAAKKEIKQAVGFQSNRLFEAMCCGRVWNVEDWKRDFHGHPLMRKLIERLIWQGLDRDGTAIAAFRPAAEGEFIDAADDDVEIARFAALRLAHASTMSAEDAAAWRRHMTDYEIKPLFDQVRIDLPMLGADMKSRSEIDDRKGWVYDAFTLRSEASRAGYERGDALDGGGFDCYTRHFGGVGIVAVLEFSGNHVAQENIPVALKTLFFERLPAGQSRGYGSNQKLRLDKLPPVLLAECWADLHRIAKKASFDPAWERVEPW